MVFSAKHQNPKTHARTQCDHTTPLKNLAVPIRTGTIGTLGTHSNPGSGTLQPTVCGVVAKHRSPFPSPCPSHPHHGEGLGLESHPRQGEGNWRQRLCCTFGQSPGALKPQTLKPLPSQCRRMTPLHIENRKPSANQKTTGSSLALH